MEPDTNTSSQEKDIHESISTNPSINQTQFKKVTPNKTSSKQQKLLLRTNARNRSQTTTLLNDSFESTEQPISPLFHNHSKTISQKGTSSNVQCKSPYKNQITKDRPTRVPNFQKLKKSTTPTTPTPPLTQSLITNFKQTVPTSKVEKHDSQNLTSQYKQITNNHSHINQSFDFAKFSTDFFLDESLFSCTGNTSIENEIDNNPERTKRPQIISSTASNNKCSFTKSTPLLEEFVPLAPSSWIEKGISPTKEHFANDLKLYEDVLSFSDNKDKWKQKSLLNYLPFYAQPKEVTVLACTWNVNQCVFTREEVDRWTSGIQSKPDIIVVALQELEMSVDAIITGKKYSEKATEWQSLLTSSVNRGTTKYTKLGYFQLCGVLLYIYYKNELKNHISEVSYSSCRVGAMSGKLANKGGVAYRFKIYDSTVCFVASHLAAHQQFIEKRNQDWAEIAKTNINFFGKDSMNHTINILDHDIVVWMGDLNYRIDLTDFEVRKFAKTKNYFELYKHDQLITSLRNKLVFNGFSEQQINFAPTFKIKIGENVYKDNRVPAWCDRVLYKTENRHHVEVKEYKSHEIYCSDHKPVTCLFSMHLQETNQQKQSIVTTYLKATEEKYNEIIIPKN
ncbi:Inositol polyphosphate 5-phosphatase [Entamoeba marina]